MFRKDRMNNLIDSSIKAHEEKHNVLLGKDVKENIRQRTWGKAEKYLIQRLKWEFKD